MSRSTVLPHTHTHTHPLAYDLQRSGPHQLLAVDPPGGRRVVEALGDVALADHVAVLVPGNGHHLGTYFADEGPVAPRGRGELLLRTMQALAPGARCAVVVWVGYHAPEGLGAAAWIAPARAGAGDLARLTHHLPRSAHLKLVGHSYGSTVCGLALADARADDCVALGSPGMGVWRREELGDGVRLWAAQSGSDWIRFFPRVRLGSVGLGRSPLHPEIGATRIGTGDVTGHCAYYEPGSESLLNVARIAVGRYDAVTPAGGAPVATDLRTRRALVATEVAA
ncbi:hypothetical protein F4692_001234 [Nocardioides cavernae]|uniref:DUF1023 domain-containing protein n=1 Tax=Nocardioides cavernae TaxID=1921566 RepID=A0A7Y9KR07_9ACTN|nr:alpha/beta hydrolase [Nocardioides cavernae]NYE36130.1 hypothetical protein [Nocardioides cavernae]